MHNSNHDRGIISKGSLLENIISNNRLAQHVRCNRHCSFYLENHIKQYFSLIKHFCFDTNYFFYNQLKPGFFLVSLEPVLSIKIPLLTKNYLGYFFASTTSAVIRQDLRRVHYALINDVGNIQGSYTSW